MGHRIAGDDNGGIQGSGRGGEASRGDGVKGRKSHGIPIGRSPVRRRARLLPRSRAHVERNVARHMARQRHGPAWSHVGNGRGGESRSREGRQWAQGGTS